MRNIADVITPERCAEELGKESKDSLFDFLDWAMAPKEVSRELSEEHEKEVNEEEHEKEVKKEKHGQDLGDAPMEIQDAQHTAY